MQLELQELSWRRQTGLRGERIRRKAGRREGSRTHFCFWGTKIKNISLEASRRVEQLDR
jgi:hypothetical protein